jgi:rod shape-determining protein MreD
MGARTGRAVLAGLLLTGAVVLQVSVLARLPLPGATPDLLLVVVASWALARGSIEGAIVGFAGGLLLDLAPPSDGPLGLTALVLAIAGALVGVVADEADRSAAAPLVILVAAALFSVTAWAGLAALTGDPRVTWAALAGQWFGQALYTAVLTPFVLPLVQRLLTRVEPAPARW